MASLAEQCVLVDFGFSTPKLTAVDKEGTAKALTDAGASAGCAKLVKDLFSPQDIKAITQFRSEVRAYHYRMTAPWLHNGPRILPSPLILDYSERIRAYRADWDRLVNGFCENYEARMENARVRLNGLFKEKDYPSVHQVRAEFGMRCALLPVPTAGDFRVAVSEEVKEELRRAEEMIQQETVRDFATKLRDCVAAMAKNLTMGNRVYDTLVTNVQDLCNVLPAFNLTNDPSIEALRVEIEATLAAVHPDDLRSDKVYAQTVGRQAEQVLSKLDQWFN
jgi:hypothetical protein